ncbi:hypothetical protein Hanom_Chr07g00643601 [Helianthus anomalus]
MDEVNELDENGKISNLLDPDEENKPLNESRKSGKTSWTKMAFYSKKNKNYLFLSSRGTRARQHHQRWDRALLKHHITKSITISTQL